MGQGVDGLDGASRPRLLDMGLPLTDITERVTLPLPPEPDPPD